MASPATRKTQSVSTLSSGSLKEEDDVPSASHSLSVSLVLQSVLQDSPETAMSVRDACAATEAAGALLSKAVKRARDLRETLRKADEQRLEMIASIRSLGALYEGVDDTQGKQLLLLCDSLEATAAVSHLEEYHVQTLFIEGFDGLSEQPGVVRAAYKALQKKKNVMEALEDKVASTERREASSNAKDLVKQDEVKAESAEARVAYRRALLDYAVTATRMHAERQQRVLRQVASMWLSQRAQLKQIEALQADTEPDVVRIVANLEEAELRAKERHAASLEERRALECTEQFVRGHVSVCAQPLSPCQGWLWRRAPGKLGMWTRRFFRITEGHLRQVGGTEAVSLVTSRVKPVSDPDRRNCFSVVAPDCELLLQAHSTADCQTWMAALEAETVRLLNSSAVESTSLGRGEQREGGADALKRLRSLDEANRHCFDCGALDPEWAVINLGVLLCIRCSGVHRSLGVQVSKVRSFQLDSWSEGELAVMQRLGNGRAATILEPTPIPHPRPSPDGAIEVREAFIVAKYVRREGLAPCLVDPNLGLFEAASSGDMVRALAMLLAGADPNEAHEHSRETSLLAGAARGDLALLELLLMHGARVSVTNAAGWSALHYLASIGDVQGCSLLFQRGADPAARNVAGATPAEMAAAHGNPDCVTLLRLAALSLQEKGPLNESSFAGVLDDFCRNLKQNRQQGK